MKQLFRHSIAVLLIVPTFVLPASSAPVPAASAPAAIALAGAVVQWQAALDQLAQGHFLEARVLLEQARVKAGDTPEINMLLAWLAERDGKSASALLAPVTAQSRLAAAWPSVSTTQPAQVPAATVVPEVGVPLNASAALVQNDARLAGLEAHMVDVVNAERRQLGLRPLSTDSLLGDTARAHSAEMRDKKYFAHESPTRTLAQPLDRYRAAFGRTPSLVAENIYRSWGSPHLLAQKDIDEAHAALMKSPGHHANIVLPDAARIGIGLVTNTNGDLWVTQMFSRG